MLYLPKQLPEVPCIPEGDQRCHAYSGVARGAMPTLKMIRGAMPTLKMIRGAIPTLGWPEVLYTVRLFPLNIS